ncbi:hypothetical protein EYF80_020513 [Liparis tanakae]|uniref:Uncharacterized protein n=1 Tax=Liparis tanakae TaxID=230148 RepID=A0A4Z2HTM1_9TELE|nr:hypothetical protein EYF80_020513 [Liparis tanakae]
MFYDTGALQCCSYWSDIGLEEGGGGGGGRRWRREEVEEEEGGGRSSAAIRLIFRPSRCPHAESKTNGTGPRDSTLALCDPSGDLALRPE